MSHGSAPRNARSLRRSIVIGATGTLLAGLAAPLALATTTPATAESFAKAISATDGLVKNAEFTAEPGTAGSSAVSTTKLGQFPVSGSSYGMLSTGLTSGIEAKGLFASTDLKGGRTRGDTDRDATILKLDLDVPAGDNCLAFDFKFLSEEYPEYVKRIYNDAFVAELDGSTWTTSGSKISAPKNFAFDANGNVVSVNSTGLGGLSAAQGAGTVFDGGVSSSGASMGGGATTLLTAQTSVTPGTHTLYLSIFDQGDSLFDSAVFIDNLRTSQRDAHNQCKAGAVVATPEPTKTATPTPTVTPTATATPTVTATPTPTMNPAGTVTPSESGTPTATPTKSAAPTMTPTGTVAPAPTTTVGPLPTGTVVPTVPAPTQGPDRGVPAYTGDN